MHQNEMLRTSLNAGILPRAKAAVSVAVAADRGGADQEQAGWLPEPITDRLTQDISAAETHGLVSPLTAAVALEDYAGDYDRLVRALTTRAKAYFWLHFLMATVMVCLFLGGVAGAILSAVLKTVNVWGIVFGGVLSLGSVFGLFVVKPLGMVMSALITTTRLDVVSLSYKHRLEGCSGQKAMDKRVACYEQVFGEMFTELDVMQAARGR